MSSEQQQHTAARDAAAAASTTQSTTAPSGQRWDERAAAVALLCAHNARLGAASPAALLVCDQYLIRDLWMAFIWRRIASELWVWGNNYYGQLGIGDTTKRILPTELTAFRGKPIAQVACGGNHTMVLLGNGELWAMGRNNEGQLGLGDSKDRTTPEQVTALAGRKVAAVACGANYTVAALGLSHEHITLLLDSVSPLFLITHTTNNDRDGRALRLGSQRKWPAGTR